MTAPIKLILLVASGLCFVIGASNLVSGEGRLRIVSAGLACYIATQLF